MILTEDKTSCYAALATAAPSWLRRDEQLLETDPQTWELVRVIDDWLVLYRGDDRVGVDQYQRQCQRLALLYAPTGEIL